MSKKFSQTYSYNTKELDSVPVHISRQTQVCIDEFDTYYALANQRLATEEKLLESCTAHKLRPQRSKSCHQCQGQSPPQDQAKGYTQMLAVKPMKSEETRNCTPQVKRSNSSTSISVHTATATATYTPLPSTPAFVHKPVLGRVSARPSSRANLFHQQQEQYEYDELSVRRNFKASAFVGARAAQDSPATSPKPYPYLKADVRDPRPRRVVSSRDRALGGTLEASPFGIAGERPIEATLTPGQRPSLTSRLSPCSSSKMVTAARVYKGSYLASLTPVGPSIVFPTDLAPVSSPKTTLNHALEKLRSGDWEANNDGFGLLVRLVRHHTETVRSHLHRVNMTALKQFANLRSQITRAACQFFTEMFTHLGKSMEYDVDKICEKLLDKSADTTKFIREDAGAALEAMIRNLSATKTLPALEIGLKHKNGIARATTAKMISLIVQKTSIDRCVVGELAYKLLPMLIKLLQEGGLEARTHAKTAVSALVVHARFQSQLKRLVSEKDLRNVAKSIASIKNEIQFDGRM